MSKTFHNITFRSPTAEEPFLNYLGYLELAAEDVYPKAQITNAYQGGKLVGSVVYGPDFGSLWVYHIYVKPAFRGQGLGKTFMDEIIDAAIWQELSVNGDFTDEPETLLNYLKNRAEMRQRENCDARTLQ